MQGLLRKRKILFFFSAPPFTALRRHARARYVNDHDAADPQHSTLALCCSVHLRYPYSHCACLCANRFTPRPSRSRGTAGCRVIESQYVGMLKVLHAMQGPCELRFYPTPGTSAAIAVRSACCIGCCSMEDRKAARAEGGSAAGFWMTPAMQPMMPMHA